MCVCVAVYEHECRFCGGHEKAPIPGELKLQAVTTNYQAWVLVTELGISAGAVCTLDPQAISPATRRLLLFPLEVKFPYKFSVLFDKRKHSQFIAFVKILLCN